MALRVILLITQSMEALPSGLSGQHQATCYPSATRDRYDHSESEFQTAPPPGTAYHRVQPINDRHCSSLTQLSAAEELSQTPVQDTSWPRHTPASLCYPCTAVCTYTKEHCVRQQLSLTHPPAMSHSSHTHQRWLTHHTPTSDGSLVTQHPPVMDHY
jgi:hypothetical protein